MFKPGLFGAAKGGLMAPPETILPNSTPQMTIDKQPLPDLSAIPERKPGVNWWGVAADFLAGLNGKAGPYAAMQAAERERAAQEADYQRRQADEYANFVKREEYKRANPAPYNNDTVNDYGFIERTLGKEAADNYLRNLGDPMVNVPLGNGQFYSGPRSGMGAALGGDDPAAPSGNIPTVSDTAGYNALKPGQQYRDPNGNLRTKGGAASNGGGNFSGR